MTAKMVPLSLLILLLCSFSCALENSCSQSLSTLQKALYESNDNLKRLNRLFYHPRLSSPREIEITYDLGESDNCSVMYLWTVGGFIFIQSPAVFTYLSLFFSVPTRSISENNKITLTLPSECRPLVDNGTICSCAKDNNLDIITQQVRVDVTAYLNSELWMFFN